MAANEHIHIITAGNDIFPAYVRALRDNAGITGTVIIADPDLYGISSQDSPEKKNGKELARNAVSRVRAHAAALKIPVSFIFISPPIREPARDAILKIMEEHPGATLSFDLSAGPKDLCMVLFSFSLWIGSKIRYTLPGPGGMFEEAVFEAPGIPVAAIAANSNYLRLLESLARRPEKPVEDPAAGLSRSYLFNQVEGCYVPKRKTGVNTRAGPPGTTGSPGDVPAVQYELAQGTFSNILGTMTAAGLIEECAGPGPDRRRNRYRITAAGDLALRLARLQSR
jgi:hypothetical protein